MAQFRATIQGARGMASRLGHKNSGLHVTANGWNAGVTVDVAHINGRDVFQVFRTGGSNNGWSRKLIAEFADGEDK